MKAIAILLIGLLLASSMATFALALSYDADYVGEQNPILIDTVIDPVIFFDEPVSDIDDQIDEVLDGEDNDDDTKRRIGFTKAWRGHGTMNDQKETGFLITAHWITQEFAIVDSDDEVKEKIVKSRGTLNILGQPGNYKLVKTDSDELQFTVYENRAEKFKEEDLEDQETFARVQADAEESGHKEIGILTLTKSEEYSGYTKWSAILAISDESSKYYGKWAVELYARDSAIRKTVVDSSEADEKIKERGEIRASDVRESKEQDIGDDMRFPTRVGQTETQAREKFFERFFNRVFSRNSVEAE